MGDAREINLPRDVLIGMMTDLGLLYRAGDSEKEWFPRLQRAVANLTTAGIRLAGPDDCILGPGEVDPLFEQALDLLGSSLREMAPISAENHRKRVIDFIANARALGRKA